MMSETAQTAEQRYRLLVEGTQGYAMILMDTAGRITLWSTGAERIMGWAEAEVLGQSGEIIFTPEDRAADVAAQERTKAASEGRAMDLRWHQRKDGSRFFADGMMEALHADDGSLRGFAKVLRDATEEGEHRKREALLNEIAERARILTDADAVIADAVRSVGQFLGVARCVFGDIDLEADTCTIVADYCADDSVASIVGTFPFSEFGPFVVAEYRAGRAVSVDDVRLDPVRVPPGNVAAYKAIGIRAHITAPVVHSSRLVSVIAVHSRVPRKWKPAEVELLQAVVGKTWLTVELTRHERALLQETEATARILGSITDAFFTVDRNWRIVRVNDQADRLMTKRREQILGHSLWEVYPQLLGTAFEREYRRAMEEGVSVTFEQFYAPLDAWLETRVYPSADGLSVFYQNVTERKQQQEALRQSEGRYRLLLESTGEGIYGIDLEGRFTFVNQSAAQMLGFAQEQILRQNAHALIHHTRPDGEAYPETACPIYRALRIGDRVYVEDDFFWRADGTSFSVSYSAAPILEQGAVRGAVVTFSDITGRKALEAERERLARRERNIAQQLQTALQPELPGTVPGLAVTRYYEAALAEAGVGGDFYDVFSVEKGCTALVVGDLSGKGLAAAAQVSIVRNMLRAFLYTKPSAAEAVTELNRVLAENNLLTGFATLWVGCYDAATGELSYVNSGQEPALLRRAATGDVELLVPTGPVLGATENALYEEQQVQLLHGDILAVFTDGATECGVSRQQMLGIEGVVSLLKPPFQVEEAQNVEHLAEAAALRLVEGVDAASRGGVAKDDICILMAVVERGISGLR